MFVVFEGIDGSGKTTVSNLVVQRLKDSGYLIGIALLALLIGALAMWLTEKTGMGFTMNEASDATDSMDSMQH